MATPTTNYNLLKPSLGEVYDVNTLDTNYDKIDTALGGHDKYAKGIIISKYATANGGPVVDGIIDNFASVTFKGGRKYEILWESDWQQDTAGSYFGMSINSASTADAAALLTGLTQLDSSTNICANINSGQHFRTTAFFEPTVDTTVQIKFRLSRLVGSGAAQCNGSTSSKIKYVIKDLGAQF